MEVKVDQGDQYCWGLSKDHQVQGDQYCWGHKKGKYGKNIIKIQQITQLREIRELNSYAFPNFQPLPDYMTPLSPIFFFLSASFSFFGNFMNKCNISLYGFFLCSHYTYPHEDHTLLTFLILHAQTTWCNKKTQRKHILKYRQVQEIGKNMKLKTMPKLGLSIQDMLENPEIEKTHHIYIISNLTSVWYSF